MANTRLSRCARTQALVQEVGAVSRRGRAELLETIRTRLYSSGVAGKFIDRVRVDDEVVLQMDGQAFRIAVRGPL